MTQNDLQSLQNISLDSCDPGSLTDIRTIFVDRSQPVPQRVSKFLDSIGNPYLFRVGDMIVKVRFDPSGKRFPQAVSDALCSC